MGNKELEINKGVGREGEGQRSSTVLIQDKKAQFATSLSPENKLSRIVKMFFVGMQSLSITIYR